MNRLARLAAVATLGLTAALVGACGGTTNPPPAAQPTLTVAPNTPVPTAAATQPTATPTPTRTSTPAASATPTQTSTPAARITCGNAKYCLDFTHGMDDEHGSFELVWSASAPVDQPWTSGTAVEFPVDGGTIRVKGGGGAWQVQFDGVSTGKLKFQVNDNDGGTATFNVAADGSFDISTVDGGGTQVDHSFTLIGTEG